MYPISSHVFSLPFIHARTHTRKLWTSHAVKYPKSSEVKECEYTRRALYIWKAAIGVWGPQQPLSRAKAWWVYVCVRTCVFVELYREAERERMRTSYDVLSSTIIEIVASCAPSRELTRSWIGLGATVFSRLHSSQRLILLHFGRSQLLFFFFFFNFRISLAYPRVSVCLLPYNSAIIKMVCSLSNVLSFKRQFCMNHLELFHLQIWRNNI